MHSLLQTVFLLALVAMVLAAPAPASMKKRSFKVERVPNPKFKGRSPGAGTRALVKAYRKFLMPLPPGLADAMSAAQGATKIEGVAEKEQGKGKGHKPSSVAAATATASAGGASNDGTGVVTATPEQGDVEYLSPVTIGGQTINMDFDSGSSDLWVFNTELAAGSQAGHSNFNPETSTTFQLLQGASFEISYGDGSGAAGNVGTDTVNIGGATVTNQAVELATAVSSSFVQDTQSNGLVGLAFSKLNTIKPVQQKTFFDNAIATLPIPVFTADLRHAAVGAYEFGNIDSTKFNGSLSWTDVNATSGFWQFSSQQFAVGTGPTMNLAGGQAIADTGTTLMIADPSIVNAYYSQVQGAVNNETVGGVTFPCAAQLPDLAVDIGGNYMATVRGDDINFSPVDAAGTTCFGGLQAGTAGGLQIYGDIMFKSQFVAFNGGNNSIGMAPHQS
ncbi:aspergillopepsin A aspartic endopeptidase [Hyphodiscus hymeniophilus]|uniref:Aspergillopepsin A aspartic endopeptidase n=1 Tax=Hyphodiscus hymeniophilus TaxID=353542 RepID=A0A9P6VED4_9HELO|nr:aspergillopepsin A aspartic endopeptidase [Hyphodiscus hymeniophilus]